MKTKYIIMSLLLASFPLVSCVDDLGSNEIEPYNEVTISGIEDQYAGVSGMDVIEITPVIESSILKDESNYEYKWFLCEGLGDYHKHTTLSTERNLSYAIDSAPANYTLYFRVVDKTTGLYWEKTTTLKVETPFVKGMYFYGDKADGTVGMDFLSCMAKDTSVIRNIFDNTTGLKGAKDLLFTGYYNASSALFAIAENGYDKVEFSSKLGSFKPLNFKLESMVFPSSIQVSKPMKLLDVFPHCYNSANTPMSRTSRGILTEDGLFVASIISGEQYGDPVNHTATGKELQKIFPQMIHTNYASFYTMFMYNLTTHAFNAFSSYMYYNSLNIKEITPDAASPFYWDQTKYSPVRDPLFIQNGIQTIATTPAKVNCLMGDANGGRWVYSFSVSYLVATNAPTKLACYTIDNSVATDLTKASHYALFNLQPILFYSVGNKLYALNYNTNKCKLIGEYDDEITYLAFDYQSADRQTDLMVASYKNGTGSTITKYDVADNPNDIVVTARPGESWKSDLKVVKVEYRNCTN